jgi:tetratricopeptide (TPR) repeat protein
VEALLGAAGDRGRRVEVVAMGQGDVRELLAGVLDGSPDARVVDLIHEKGQGNPLFSAELAAMLAENGTLVRRDGRWRLASGPDAPDVPRTLGVLFGARLDELPPLLVETLWACAVSGRRPDADVVARVLGLDPEVTHDRLQRLADLGFLTRAGEAWQFRHALLREAVDGRLSLARRRDLHLRAAEAVAGANRPGAQADAAIGAHLMAGEAPRLALPYLAASAGAARSIHAHRDAVAVLREAVSAAAVEPRDARWPALLADLGDSLEAIGDYEPSRVAFAEAAEAATVHPDPDLWIQARAREAAVRRRTGAYDEALARLDDALSAVDLAGVDGRAVLLERARTLHLLGRLEEAREAVDSALAASVHDPTRGRLLMERAALAARTGDLALAASFLDEAMPLLSAGEDLAGAVGCLTFRGEVHERSGEISAAGRVYRRALVVAEQLGRVEEVAAIRNNLGFLALASEDWSAAQDIFGAAAEEFAQVGHRAGHVTAAANQSYALAMLGELEAAAEISESAGRGAEELGRIAVAADARTTRALVAKLAGDLPGARALAVDALATARLSGDPDLVVAAEELVSELDAAG